MSDKPVSDGDVAIIGMACRFPGANNLDEYWQMIRSGKSMHTKVPSTRFSQHDLWRLGNATPDSFWGNFLDNPDAFDHAFFGISAREATSMDPQQRLALQVAYEAVESAAYFDLSTNSRSIGVFLGVGSVDYQDNVSSNPSNAFSALGTLRAFISGRISHYFGWTGPSITFDTSCSSSAVAIHSACKAILSGECSAALAGGVNVITSPLLYEDLSKSGFLSPTGPCKPFDANADGYCRGEGAGMLYLKKLSAAVSDNDSILGIITSSAINQGDNSTPITVPHVSSQTSLYRRVLDIAGLEASQIGFVEAHGTGTPVGDPIEFESIRQVFGPERSDTLFVGSVKGSIGHTEAASGVAAAIKAVLIIQNDTVPKQANFAVLNPKINSLQLTRIEVPRQTRAWHGSAVFVSNYGAAGSNAAFIICKPRARQAAEQLALVDGIKSQKQPILITAHSETSFRLFCAALLNFLTENSLSKNEAINLPDLGFALARRANRSLPISFSTSVTSLPELQEALMNPEPQFRRTLSNKQVIRNPVVLCFGGQTKKSIGLCEDVYRDCTLLRMYLDHCETICRSRGVFGFYPQIFGRNDVNDVVLLHSMLFSLQYACAKAWIECGLRVDVLIGHSFGHLAALCVSEVLSLDQALQLVIDRATLFKRFWGVETGAMLSVESDSEQVLDLLASISSQKSAPRVEVACYNGPRSHVLVGSESAIETVEKAVSGRMRCRRLDVTHGFHSHLMDPILPELATLAGKLDYRKPKIHVEACTKCQSRAVDGTAIVQHSREPVYFAQAIERIAARGTCTWIEAGTNSGIINLARNVVSPSVRDKHTFQSVSLNHVSSVDSLAETTVKLWRSGVQVQFWLYHRVQKALYKEINLPPYQFDKPNHWLKLCHTISQSSTPQPGILSLVSFVRPQNEQRSLAEFRINTSNPQFRSYVEGHKVLGYGSCPASVYLHLAAQALAQLIEKESSVASTVEGLRVEKLVMPSPLRNDYERMITLETESHDDSPNRWAFQLLSRSLDDISNATSHARGEISLEMHVQGTTIRDHSRSGNPRNDDVEQTIAGPFIYNVFSAIVNYSEVFRGVKNVSADVHGVSGRVLLPDSRDMLPSPSICNPLLVDNFLQVAGLYVNCLRENTSGKIFVCSQIGQFCYQNNLEDQGVVPWDVVVHIDSMSERETICDIVAYPTASENATIKFSGVRFTGISRNSLMTTLSGTRHSKESVTDHTIMDLKEGARDASQDQFAGMVNGSAHTERAEILKRNIFFRLRESLKDITGVAASNMLEDSRLEDVGVDSLVIIELLDEIEKGFKVNISLSEFEQLKDLKSLAQHIESKTTKILEDVHVQQAVPEILHQSGTQQKANDLDCRESRKPMQPSASDAQHFSPQIKEAFEEVQRNLVQLIRGARLEGYTQHVAAHQQDLVAAYIIEAFTQLDAYGGEVVTNDTKPGPIHPKHAKLTAQLWRILEDTSAAWSGTKSSLRCTSHEEQALCFKALQLGCSSYPQHRSEYQLLATVGTRLADCLSGAEDPLHILFGNKINRNLLAEVYTNAPVFSTGTRLLSTFISRLLGMKYATRPVRILEIGGGVGGTTTSIIKLLEEKNCAFIYTFTDISPSLVAAAKQKFHGHDRMEFRVLDAESLPDKALLESQDIIISTNTIHATRSLSESCANIRRMLSENGVLCLVELTRPLAWFDIVFGLLDGWWRFNDGRTHAIADAQFWDRSLRDAGFENVHWTDADHKDNDLIRLIVASGLSTTEEKSLCLDRSTKITMETVLFRQIENNPLYADIYYPSEIKFPPSKRPIALLIHGGGHIMLSRKDIRPGQSQHLLENGIIPISIDHRLCPELDLIDGPMTDVCHALDWIRNDLPNLKLRRPDMKLDCTKVAAIGWSTGGTLALSLGWTASIRGLKPPEAILVFYCPTDYTSVWYQEPHFPWRTSQADAERKYDLWEAVHNSPITGFNIASARTPGGWMSTQDARARIPLHMNWTGQTLPILLGALTSEKKKQRQQGSSSSSSLPPHDGSTRLPMPSLSRIEAISPRAQIAKGNYRTPTYFVHGAEDEFIPVQETRDTYRELVNQGVQAGISIVEGGGHMFEMLGMPKGDERVWQAVIDGYRFLFERLRG
ncbi:MAG: hypothetical protein LQ343_005531 [Gyalolechia ehrenbergii]|nr:MAG: hypothetical protein LQ343_005531 [Gyalolechia ehrenbergii]